MSPFPSRHLPGLAPALLGLASAAGAQATVVPNEVQQPGTQPGELTLEAPTKCDNCHAGYDPAVEPTHNWLGSMMAHASRDPLFWATVAITEQDFAGAGDLCLRCHVYEGWVAGRSTPTDGSALLESDAGGVSCDVCHQLTDPDGTEHFGVQNAPFVAQVAGEAMIGSGMLVVSPTIGKLGPYADAASPHASSQSLFHRSSELCGSCHDVSNPAVGDLAPGNGAQLPLDPGQYSGVLGAPLTTKAAFLNLPHRYGVVERTYSEHVTSLFPSTPVSQYAALPAELQDGSIEAAWTAATAAVPGGNYADGTTRSFTCQTCHMPPVQGKGCNKSNAPVRADLPLHDLTGGSTWIQDAIAWLDAQGELPLGGGLSSNQLAALAEGQGRALAMLRGAAALEVQGDTLRVVNLTGHKFISGYPEGRRAWLHVAWYDADGGLLRVDGEYGWLEVQHEGQPLSVRTLLDPEAPELRIYHAVPGMTQAWAAALVAPPYSVPPSLPLSYDRATGAVAHTLGELAAMQGDAALETFHFVLNDTVLEDTRIPPWGMEHDPALERGILPVPAAQYGAPGPGGTFEHWDEVSLDPPPGAATADIELLYQSTSWEFVQFLALANTGQSSFLADAGDELLEAWLATAMAEPEVVATASWAASGAVAYCTAGTSASGCQALLSASGAASATATSGFVLAAAGVEGQKDGLFFFGTNGRQANPWGNGTSYQCVVPPVKRAGLLTGHGTQGACDGSFQQDLNALWCPGCPAPLKNPGAGASVQAQLWYRDPQNTSNQTTSLSNALEFPVAP